MTIPAITTINDGDAVEVAPINANFTNVRTSLNGNLDNTNWSSGSGSKLGGTKVDLSSNVEFTTEHDSTSFAHSTTASNFRRFRVTPNTSSAANVISQVDVNAQLVSLEARSGSGRLLTSSTTTGSNVVDLTVSLAANGPLGIDNGADDGREASTTYHIWLVADSSGTDTPDLTCVFSKESTASTTFWTNIDDHVMTGGAADYALLVGAVFNDANDRIRELPRALSGGSNGNLFMPVFCQSAVGFYAGNGSSGRWIDVGFSPSFVMIKRTDSGAGVWTSSAHTVGNVNYWQSGAEISGRISALGWGNNTWGFQVSDHAEVNLTGGTIFYHWMAIRNHNVGAPSS